MKNINMDVVPKTLDEAVQLLMGTVEPGDLPKLLGHDPAEYHHGMGRWLRNNWSLWDKDCPLAQWFRQTLGLGHADDMSGVILDAFWAKLGDKSFDAQQEAEHYHAFWRRQKIDPLTMEKLV